MNSKVAIASLLATALGLSACATGTSVSCTVTYNPNNSTGKGQTKAAEIAPGDVASIDSSAMSATITGSGTITSDPGVFTVTLLQSGSVVASTQAAYVRSGNTFTAADPAGLNSWIHGYSNIDEVDVTLDNVGFSQVEGTNSMQLSVTYNGGSYGTATTTWQGPPHQQY